MQQEYFQMLQTCKKDFFGYPEAVNSIKFCLGEIKGCDKLDI